MNKLKSVIYLIFFFLVMGCATATTTKLAKTESINSDTLLVGVLQQKTIGEPMIAKIHLIYYPGFIAESDYTTPNDTTPNLFGTKFPVVIQGSVFSCPRIYEDGNYLCYYPQYYVYGLIINSSGIPIGFENYMGVIYHFPEEQSKIFKKTEIAQPGSFKQELIYNGKSKDTIRIAYREFKDDFARPAFSQDLTYDMTESKEIGFRGMIIEVIEATNSFIKFIVKQPMTQ